MDRAKEIVSLIKFSPKRENLLGESKENQEGPESEVKVILGLCPTRWTVRARCFQRILDNHAALLQPSFDTYAKMESLLIKTLNSQDKSEELRFMEKTVQR